MDADTTPAPLTHRQVLVVFSGIMLGMFLAAIDQTIVATALPTIAGELGGLSHLSWVVTAYLLAETVATPLYGKLGDLYGRKRVFQSAIVLFLAGSVLCGLSASMGQLVAFRAIQGAGAGGIIVGAQALIADIVSPRERGRYQGYFGAVFGLSSVAGPLIGGFLTEHASWRWVFYVNLPIGLVALVVTSIVLPASIRRERVRIDWLGTTVLSAAIVCLVLVTTWGGNEHAWGSPLIVGLSAAAVVLGVVFVLVERRVEEPAIPLRLFRNRTFNIASAVSLIIGAGMFGAISYLPTFLQIGGGVSESNSGLLLVPVMAGLLMSSIAAGRRVSRTGRYRHFPIAGMAVAAVGMGLLSTLDTGSSRLESGAYMFVLGAGLGMVMQILVLATQNEAPVADLGVATSTVTFFRVVGGSLGVALAGSLINSRLSSALGGEPPSDLTPELLRSLPAEERAVLSTAYADAITAVFAYAVPVLLVGFALTWLLRAVPLRTVAARVAAASEAAGAEPAAHHATVEAAEVRVDGAAAPPNGSSSSGAAPADMMDGVGPSSTSGG
ncbi:MAG: MDR family MFS transporter [Thermoanaerobacterales bacterium]